MNPYFDASKAHHTRRGFRNNYVQSAEQSWTNLLRWQWQRLTREAPPKVARPIAQTAPDLALIQAQAETPAEAQTLALSTWLGHASLLIQASGLNILTDPVFSPRASPVSFLGPKRITPVGMALDLLPAIDVVLISHNHYDHLDRATILALHARHAATVFLVPLGIKAWMQRLGITRVHELDWWQSETVRDVEFHFTPAQHWSARGLTDRSKTLWGGWAVLGAHFHWYFTGDSGYSADFVDIRRHFQDRQSPAVGGGFDLALVPIGAYEPRWFMQRQHVNPAEAVQIHCDLGAKQSVGIHWGTFLLTDEASTQPPIDLAEALALRAPQAPAFAVMAIGETRTWPLRRIRANSSANSSASSSASSPPVAKA